MKQHHLRVDDPPFLPPLRHRLTAALASCPRLQYLRCLAPILGLLHPSLRRRGSLLLRHMRRRCGLLECWVCSAAHTC